MKHLEIRTIEKNGVKVTLKIDYDKGRVSLVDNYQPGFQVKKWVFADRSLEYMGGWLQILDAMKFAIQEATRELEMLENQKIEAMVEMENRLDASISVLHKKPGKKSKYANVKY